MKEVILITTVLLFLVFLVFLFLKNKEKKETNNTINYEKITEHNPQIGKPRPNSNFGGATIDLVDNKSTSSGFIAGQLKQQMKKQQESKKNIGWVQTKSYEEDIKDIIPQELKKENESNEKLKKSITILVVDDSITVLKFISNIFKNTNYTLITKEDGAAAMEYLRSITIVPDLIITDIEMPRMTGPELIKKLREEKKFNNTPILLVSSNPSPHLNLLEEGLINGIIQKPFKNEELLNQVKYLLNN